MVATAPSAPSTTAGQGRNASRIASDGQEATQVSPENAVSEHLTRRRSAQDVATCIGRARPHCGDAHPGRRRSSGPTRDGRYYRARYYHPGLSRFISEDPIGFAGGDVNLYACVLNNPTAFADPYGLEPVTISTGVALAIVCGVGAVAGDAVVLAVNGRKTTWEQLAAGAGIGCVGGVGVLGAYAAAAGAFGVSAAETGAQFMLRSWYQSTFYSISGTVIYHWRLHAARYGKSAVQYTRDAVEFFRRNQHLAKDVTLRDGSPGVRIRTPGGGPGGIFTPDGRVVTFWY